MTTVVIVDDHPIVRAGMRTILTNTDGITVVAEGARGADALRLVAEYRPDVLVLDVNLPDISGVEVTRKLRAQGTQTAILVLTVHNDRQTVFGLLESGATGYVLKNDALETLVSAVRAVARGGQHLQPDPPDASHAWFDPNLAVPNLRGTWFIGNQSLYSVNGYLFEIPADWANAHASNRYLGTGRYRDGGWSGMGPALFAYRPWTDERGTPPPTGTHLPETTLLLYASQLIRTTSNARSTAINIRTNGKGARGSRRQPANPPYFLPAPKARARNIGTAISIRRALNCPAWMPISSDSLPCAASRMARPARRAI